MVKLTKITREAIVVESFVCNKCGRELKKFDDEGTENTPDGTSVSFLSTGLIEASVFFKNDEMVKEYTFSLCDECVKKMFENFDIEPTLQDCSCDECDCCDECNECIENDEPECECKDCNGCKKLN